MKKLLALLLAMIMLLSFTACGSSSSSTADDGKSHVKIILVLEDETEVPYEIAVTPGVSLREGLKEAGLITEEEFGAMFVATIDEYTADWMGDPARTWEVRDENDNQIQGFFEDIILEDGATYRLVDTLVPNFDD